METLFLILFILSLIGNGILWYYLVAYKNGLKNLLAKHKSLLISFSVFAGATIISRFLNLHDSQK